MTNSSISTQIITQLKQLDENQQQQVLDFTRFLAMKKPVGVPGKELLRFAGTIPKDDLEQMSEAIEEECGKIDWDEW